MNHRRLNAHRVDLLVQYAKNHTYEQCSKRFKLGRVTVYRYLKEAGALGNKVGRPRKISDKTVSTLIQLKKKGLTIRECAERCEINANTAHRYLKINGETRKRDKRDLARLIRNLIKKKLPRKEICEKLQISANQYYYWKERSTPQPSLQEVSGEPTGSTE